MPRVVAFLVDGCQVVFGSGAVAGQAAKVVSLGRLSRQDRFEADSTNQLSVDRVAFSDLFYDPPPVGAVAVSLATRYSAES